jgi:hypothetical protein
MLMDKQGNAQERVVIGFMLFCLEGRLRVADAQRLREEPVLDVDSSGLGYIEAKAGVVKTSQAKRMKAKVLQIAGHSQDLAGRGWAAEWLALRRAEGMDVVRDGWLQPHPLVGGGWGRALMKSSELGVFLRSLLVDTQSEKQGRITAHTLKATYLSWCAKYGVKKGTRKMLGYRSSKKDASMLAYSRDARAGPLRRLAEVLDAVRQGRFDPDATRSGRHLSQAAVSSTAPMPSSRQGAKRKRAERQAELVIQKLKQVVHIRGAVWNDTRCKRKVTELYAAYRRGNRAQDRKVTFCAQCYPSC